MEVLPPHYQVEPDYHSHIEQLSMAAEAVGVKLELH